MLHTHPALPGRRGNCPIDTRGGGQPLTPEHAQLVLEIVRLGFVAVVLVVIALLVG